MAVEKLQNATAYNFNFFLNGERIPGDFPTERTDLFLKDIHTVINTDEKLSEKSQMLHDQLLNEAGIKISDVEKIKQAGKINRKDHSAYLHYRYDFFSGGLR